MVNIGIYFDNLNSFMAHINSLRAEMQKDNFFCTSKVWAKTILPEKLRNYNQKSQIVQRNAKK